MLVLSSASHTLVTRKAARRRVVGAAPSVATAGRPRLDRQCASQPRATSEQDEHTCQWRAPSTILALEPSILIPIYLVHIESLMFLHDRKRVFTPRGDRSRIRYLDARDRDAAWPFLCHESFRCYVTIERGCALLFGRECILPVHAFDYYDLFGKKDFGFARFFVTPNLIRFAM